MSEFMGQKLHIQFRLPPCKCGSEDVAYEARAEDQGAFSQMFFQVTCPNCFRKTDWHPSLHDAQNAWCEVVRRR